MEEFLEENRFTKDIENLSFVKKSTIEQLNKLKKTRDNELKIVKYVKTLLEEIPIYYSKIADIKKELEEFNESPIEENKLFKPHVISDDLRKKMSRLAYIRKEKGRGFKNEETESITKEFEQSIIDHKKEEQIRIGQLFLEKEKEIIEDLVYNPPDGIEKSISFKSIESYEEFLRKKQISIGSELLLTNNQIEAYESILSIIDDSLERINTVLDKFKNMKNRKGRW